jgi:hypothetical protein
MTMPRRAAAARAIDACMAGRAAVLHAGSAAAAAACMAPARWLRVPQRRLLQPSGALHPGSEEVWPLSPSWSVLGAALICI